MVTVILVPTDTESSEKANPEIVRSAASLEEGLPEEVFLGEVDVPGCGDWLLALGCGAVAGVSDCEQAVIVKAVVAVKAMAAAFWSLMIPITCRRT